MLRSIKPEEFDTVKQGAAAIIDIRRDDDFHNSDEIVSGASWQDPSKIEDWIASVPRDGQVIVYCVRGGGVSNSVVDRLHADGINAQFVEGGIEALKSTEGTVQNKN